jgi:hypothetical protein
MAKRREKPSGKEHWTWREIDAGYKMSRGQRRAAHQWETISKGGPAWQAFYIAILVLGAIIALLSGKK